MSACSIPIRPAIPVVGNNRRFKAIHAQVVRCQDAYRLARKLRTQAKSLSRSVGKEAIIQACRSRLGDRAIQWLDAAVVLGSENDLSFPPLLGSGANEGRLDYSNTFMGCVTDLWLENTDDQRALALLRHALLGVSASGLVNKPVGQYDPGRAWGL